MATKKAARKKPGSKNDQRPARGSKKAQTWLRRIRRHAAEIVRLTSMAPFETPGP